MILLSFSGFFVLLGYISFIIPEIDILLYKVVSFYICSLRFLLLIRLSLHFMEASYGGLDLRLLFNLSLLLQVQVFGAHALVYCMHKIVTEVFYFQLKITKIAGSHWLYFSDKLYKYLWVAFSYFLNLLCPLHLEAKGKATNTI